MSDTLRLVLPRLVLKNCVVRPWRAHDAPALAAHANNPKIAANLRDRFPHPYTEAAAHEYIAERIDSPGPSVTFAIEIEGEAAGGLGFHRLDDIHRLCAEVGYWISERHWGKGIATEALRAASDWAFGALGLQRLFATVFAENRASARVAEKAGFELEGRLRRGAIKHGKILDLLLYARLAP